MADTVPVIILNWNGEADTLECLASIKAADHDGFAPVVVDNGSRPESLAQLRAAGGFTLIEAGENLGFAAGCNLGIRKSGATRWVLLLNNDTVVDPGFFKALREFIATNPTYAAATAQVRDYGNRNQVQNCGGELTFFGGRRYRRAATKPIEKVTFATGCALLMNLEETGLLSERFFFGEEDYELALRLKSQGKRMACVNGAVVYHKVGASVGRATRALGSIRHYLAVRLLDTRNHYPAWRWQATRFLYYAWLPMLLARSGIFPLAAPAVIRDVERFIASHDSVTRADFQALIA